jgi:hypothetical protein
VKSHLENRKYRKLFSPIVRSCPVMGSLEALPRLEAVSRQYFHCLGLSLGLGGHCLDLGASRHETKTFAKRTG